MSAAQYLLLGAGTHARVVLDALRAGGDPVAGCLDPSKPTGPWPSGVPWLGGDDHLDTLTPGDWRLINCMGSTGDTNLRQRVFQDAVARGFSFAVVRHPSAIIAQDVVIGQGCQVLAGAIVQTGARLGVNVLVNTGAIVEHDADIADHVHIAPGVTLSGNVSVGVGVHLGTGVVVKQGVTIGANAVIGVGAIVIADVPVGACYVGNPARAMVPDGQGTI
tara:strand:+ start:13826 stop:14482 length:657 start_codon:yes stop_codon:yes gene_type:complete